MNPDKVVKISAVLRDCLDGVIHLCARCPQPCLATHFVCHSHGIAWLCEPHSEEISDTHPFKPTSELEEEDPPCQWCDGWDCNCEDFETSDTIPCLPPDPEPNQ